MFSTFIELWIAPIIVGVILALFSYWMANRDE